MPALKKGADGPWEFRWLSGYFQVGGRKNVAFQLDLKVTSPGKGEERTQPEQRQRQDTERCWVRSISGGHRVCLVVWGRWVGQLGQGPEDHILESGHHPAALESPSQGRWVRAGAQLASRWVPPAHPYDVSRADGTSCVVFSGTSGEGRNIWDLCTEKFLAETSTDNATYHWLGVT